MKKIILETLEYQYIYILISTDDTNEDLIDLIAAHLEKCCRVDKTSPCNISKRCSYSMLFVSHSKYAMTSLFTSIFEKKVKKVIY